MGQVHLSGMIIFPQGASHGCSAPWCTFETLTSRFLFVFMFFILAFLRHICCQGNGSRSNASKLGQSYVKDSHYATALLSSYIQNIGCKYFSNRELH